MAAVIAAALLVTFASDASAQLNLIGGTANVGSLPTGIVRGVDTAYDPVANQYMVVGGHTMVAARCLNADGTPVGGQIVVNSGSVFGAFPRAAYSRHANGGAGAFLVVWVEESGPSTYIVSQMVSCS